MQNRECIVLGANTWYRTENSRAASVFVSPVLILSPANLRVDVICIICIRGVWQWHLPNACTFTGDALFIYAWKTDLIFVFLFFRTFKDGFDFRFTFLHGLLLKKRFEFRISFLRDCENRINASVIWNSWTPLRGWPRYCGAFQFIITPFLLPGRLPGTRNSNLFFKNKLPKNEINSVFQSDAKTKNESQICFSKWTKTEKQNSNPFFNVMRNRKTKNRNGIWIPFSHPIEKRMALRYTLFAR